MEICVGVDIGGTHMSVVCIDRSCGKLLHAPEESIIDCTALDPPALLDAIDSVLSKAIASCSSGNKVLVGIGIGCPGQSRDGVLVAASNLPRVKNFPLAEAVSKRHGNVPTQLMNDADAAVCAEVWGSTTSHYYSSMQNIAMLTLGTGIGCGLVLNRMPYRGSNGLIEAGHMIVSHEFSYAPRSQQEVGTDESIMRRCPCGQRGCVEMYSSAKNCAYRLEALIEDANEATGEEITGRVVFERFHRGDPLAVQAVHETAAHLAVACINICRVVDPDAIIIAGGLANAGMPLINLINDYLQRKTWSVLATDVELVAARNLAACGAEGAALAAKAYLQQRQGGTVATVKSSSLSFPLEVAVPLGVAIDNDGGQYDSVEEPTRRNSREIDDRTDIEDEDEMHQQLHHHMQQSKSHSLIDANESSSFGETGIGMRRRRSAGSYYTAANSSSPGIARIDDEQDSGGIDSVAASVLQITADDGAADTGAARPNETGNDLGQTTEISLGGGPRIEVNNTAMVYILLRIYSGYFVICSAGMIMLGLLYNSNDEIKHQVDAALLHIIVQHMGGNNNTDSLLSSIVGNSSTAAGNAAQLWSEGVMVLYILTALHTVILLGAGTTIILLLK